MKKSNLNVLMALMSAMLLVSFCAGTVHAATLTENMSSGVDFFTIQEAIDNAALEHYPGLHRM